MRLRIHPLCPVMILAALFLGEGTRMAALVFSVTLHELAHILAAYACHVPVVELEMMPCGGAARFDNVWRMRPRVICLVALCGPLTNWLLACISAALGWWGLLVPQTAALLIECNFGLMLFNLLPALPLDGGRVAACLLMKPLSPRRAVTLCIRSGQVLGAALTALGLGMALYQKYNLTLILCGVYLMLSAPAEKRQLHSAALHSLMGRSEELARERVLPVRTLAVSPDLLLSEASGRMFPGCMHRFFVPLEGGGLYMVDEQEFLRGLMGDSTQSFAQLAEKKQKKSQKK